MIDNRLFEKYDGLIFDMDGTLIDTMPVHARAWAWWGNNLVIVLTAKLCMIRWRNCEHYRLRHYARCRYVTRTFK